MSATAIKRLTVDLTPDEHRRLRTLAAERGVPMVTIVREGLTKEIHRLRSRRRRASEKNMTEAGSNGKG